MFFSLRTKYIIDSRKERNVFRKGEDDDRVSEKETTMPIISQVVRPIPIALSLKTSSFLLFLPHAFYTELYVAISSGSLHIYARESTICDSLFAKGSFRFGKSALLLSRAFLTRFGEELNVSLMMIIHIPLLNIIKKKINSIFPIIISFVSFSTNNFTLTNKTPRSNYTWKTLGLRLVLNFLFEDPRKFRQIFARSHNTMLCAKISCAILSLD